MVAYSSKRLNDTMSAMKFALVLIFALAVTIINISATIPQPPPFHLCINGKNGTRCPPHSGNRFCGRGCNCTKNGRRRKWRCEWA
uniref:Uncharacterized protein n=1 Tax=Rhipicephalus zambeziensis TaxID=60191 RepID=A0A224Y9Y0_9ACAR